MKLRNICLLSNHVAEMIEFYKALLGREPEYVSSIYAEFHLGEGSLCIFSMDEHNKMAPNSAVDTKDKSFLVEIEVTNVMEEYFKLKNLGIKIIKGPTVQPWGTKSVYFRDVDRNLINFFSYRTFDNEDCLNG